jgi:hypothetical protein
MDHKICFAMYLFVWVSFLKLFYTFFCSYMYIMYMVPITF